MGDLMRLDSNLSQSFNLSLPKKKETCGAEKEAA